MYTSLIRPLLFQLPAEKAHHLTFNSLKAGMRLPGLAAEVRNRFVLQDKRLERNLFGLSFPNPVGLAAGLDKNAELVDELENFGFGFIEIGTLTPKGQAGNPQPRLFRLPKDKGLINRMGFNNEGVHAAVDRLRRRKGKVLIGGNIGKNKDTANSAAVDDYRYCFEALYQVVDYFVVNVSSPNTPNLRDLQDKGPLRNILMRLQEVNHGHPHPKPILLKIAPDLSRPQLDDILELAEETQLAGLIATNTTIKREPLTMDKEKVAALGAGGLSGKPLAKRSTEVIRYLSHNSGGKLPIIGVGGIFSAEDALEKLAAGASLVQVYTGFVYEGPALVRRINEAILAGL